MLLGNRGAGGCSRLNIPVGGVRGGCAGAPSRFVAGGAREHRVGERWRLLRGSSG